MSKHATILVFESKNVIQEVFTSEEESDNFIENMPQWQINAYDWIGVSNIEELETFDFENNELKEKAYNYFNQKITTENLSICVENMILMLEEQEQELPSINYKSKATKVKCFLFINNYKDYFLGQDSTKEKTFLVHRETKEIIFKNYIDAIYPLYFGGYTYLINEITDYFTEQKPIEIKVSYRDKF